MRVDRGEADGYRKLIDGVDVPRGLIVLDTGTLRVFTAVADVPLRVCQGLSVAVLALRQHGSEPSIFAIKKDRAHAHFAKHSRVGIPVTTGSCG
jgi:hypothetical protein